MLKMRDTLILGLCLLGPDSGSERRIKERQLKCAVPAANTENETQVPRGLEPFAIYDPILMQSAQYQQGAAHAVLAFSEAGGNSQEACYHIMNVLKKEDPQGSWLCLGLSGPYPYKGSRGCYIPGIASTQEETGDEVQCVNGRSRRPQYAENLLDLANSLKGALTYLTQESGDRQIDVTGFSLGAEMTQATLISNPDQVGNVVVFGGSLLGDQIPSKVHPNLNGRTLFMQIGSQDRWFPQKQVNETVTLFKQWGANTDQFDYFNGGHQVPQNGWAKAAQFLIQNRNQINQ